MGLGHLRGSKMTPIDPDDLSEDEVQAIINSTGFQKMLRYRRLAQGIEVLEEEDEIFNSLVTSITDRHSTVGSKNSVREFFQLFQDEVETFTEPMVDEEGEPVAANLDDVLVEESDQ